MSYQTIQAQKREYILVIYMHNSSPSKIRATLLSEELKELCVEIPWDEDVRVLVLTGKEEGFFSMGVGLNGADSFEGEKIECHSITDSIAKLDRPVIATISGDAIGQGLELALACDIRIASETSRFGLPQIKAGHIPWDGGTQRLSRLVGKGKALEIILTGEVIDAQEALRIGLVNKVVPKKDLMEVAMKIAQEMASKGPIALRYIKEAIYKGLDMTLEQGLHLEADLYLLIHTTKDRTEGIQAFREKRKPKFEGK